MNIFRVLASGKHKFREEFVSSFLGYLLSPKMDHGLGASLLLELLKEVAKTNNSVSELEFLIQQINDNFREDLFGNSDQQAVVELELPYQNSKGAKGFIDIVIKVADWFIIIENKILMSSKTYDQVYEQYRGFKKVLKDKVSSDSKILFLYLVPGQKDSSGWSISNSLFKEVEVEADRSDVISIISWHPVEDKKIVSITRVIRKILKKDAYGEISPLGNEIKQTLKSFLDFILGEFQGYSYERATELKDVSKKKVKDILLSEEEIYIGVQYGLGGIIAQGWRNKAFLEKTLNISDRKLGWQYIDLKTFKIMTNWAISPDNQKLSGIEWSGRPFGIEALYKVAKTAGNEIYIGLSGGLRKLTETGTDEIKSGTLGSKGCLSISTIPRNNNKWFSGTDFVRVLEGKGIYFN